MRLFNIIWCILFIVFAALQYNDPDPYLWIPIYGYAAVLCWLAYRRQYYPKAYLAGIIFYTLYGMYKLFDENGLLDWLRLHDAENIAATMKAEKPWIEESREFFGLLLLVIVLGINYVIVNKKRKSITYPGTSTGVENKRLT